MNKFTKRVVTMLMAGGTYETYWDPKTKTNKPGISIEPNSSDERMVLDLVRDGMPIKVINLYRDGKCSAKAIISTVQELRKPRVLVIACDGLVEAIHNEGVDVLILNYDDVDPEYAIRDCDGKRCAMGGTAIMEIEHIDAQFAKVAEQNSEGSRR